MVFQGTNEVAEHMSAYPLRRFVPLLLACYVFDQRAASAPPITPTATVDLFNKKDLTGFYTWLVDTKREDSRRVFAVTNGMIRITGEGLGYLGTEKEYRDYHLLAEFKWGKTNWPWGDRIGKARDSGIFLHATGPDGNSHDGKGAFMAAIECNIFQGATGDFLLIRGTAADGSLIAPRLIAEVLALHEAIPNPTLEDVLRVDAWARATAVSLMQHTRAVASS